MACATSAPNPGSHPREYPTSLVKLENLDNITFVTIEIETGEIIDRKEFKYEYIYLTHHAGVHLYDDTFLVTSIQNQCVYMMKIIEGKFQDVRAIGYHNYEDDEFVVQNYLSKEERNIKEDKEIGRVIARPGGRYATRSRTLRNNSSLTEGNTSASSHLENVSIIGGNASIPVHRPDSFLYNTPAIPEDQPLRRSTQSVNRINRNRTVATNTPDLVKNYQIVFLFYLFIS